MQRICSLLFLLFLTRPVMAQSGAQPFMPGAIDVTFADTLVREGNKSFGGMDFSLGTPKDNTDYRICYSLFRQVAGSDDLPSALAVYAVEISARLAGDMGSLASCLPLNDRDIRNTYSGNFGTFCLIEGSESSFMEGFSKAQVRFFCRIGLGVVCQVTLYNDSELLTGRQWEQDSKSFTFEYLPPEPEPEPEETVEREVSENSEEESPTADIPRRRSLGR